MCEEHNGWTNRATSIVNLWLRDKPQAIDGWYDRAQAYLLQGDRKQATGRIAQDLQATAERQVQVQGLCGMLGDLLSATVATVDWLQIAKNIVEEAWELLEEEVAA